MERTFNSSGSASHQQRLALVHTPCGRPTLAALCFCFKSQPQFSSAPALWLQCSLFPLSMGRSREPQGARNECAVPHTLHFSFQVLNVSFAFELMQDGGLEKPKPRPEGTLLFPRVRGARGTQVFMAQSMIRVWIPKGDCPLKTAFAIAREGGTGHSCSVLGMLVSCRLHSHGEKKNLKSHVWDHQYEGSVQT